MELNENGSYFDFLCITQHHIIYPLVCLCIHAYLHTYILCFGVLLMCAFFLALKPSSSVGSSHSAPLPLGNTFRLYPKPGFLFLHNLIRVIPSVSCTSQPNLTLRGWVECCVHNGSVWLGMELALTLSISVWPLCLLSLSITTHPLLCFSTYPF